MAKGLALDIPPKNGGIEEARSQEPEARRRFLLAQIATTSF